MKLQKNLRAKIFGGFALLFVFLAGLFGVDTYLAFRVIGFQDESLTQQKEAQFMLELENAHLVWMNDLKESLLTEKSFTGILDHTKCKLGTWYYEYTTTAEYQQMSPEMKSVLKELEEPHRLLHAYGAEAAALINSGKLDEAEKVYRQKLTPVTDKTYSLLRELMNDNLTRSSALTKQAEAEHEKVIRLYFIISVAGMIIAGLTAAYLSTGIARPIQATIETIATTTAEVAASVEQNERTAISQSSSVAEITSTMEELRISSDQSFQQARRIADNAQLSAQAAVGGMGTAEDTAREMRELKEKVNSIAVQMLNLSEQVGQIGAISGTVKELADQTNMLALNAAVEAARAGEHGRGFAVVSAEIRKLADQSKKASQRIGAIVGEVQKATNTTVMVTEEGTKKVDATERFTLQTVEAFGGLHQSMAEISHYIQQVSLNLQQQSEAVSGVTSAMEEILRGTKETAAAISQTKSGMQNLNKVGIMLKDMV
ncbi:chemotaxis protein [Heliobacterium undosum]|uniref:Chemotaxis protein n=1 Tax=Heliomicrobium undosum TaxID=121734 RepID=A0A845L1N6_9FIRM|nr:methyl-accepting chemotaxis protein [Heliomicrobium undosum]MZP28919.1 chemotaxis protein [Heliomicrobium undosum]